MFQALEGGEVREQFGANRRMGHPRTIPRSIPRVRQYPAQLRQTSWDPAIIGEAYRMSRSPRAGHVFASPTFPAIPAPLRRLTFFLPARPFRRHPPEAASRLSAHALAPFPERIRAERQAEVAARREGESDGGIPTPEPRPPPSAA